MLLWAPCPPRLSAHAARALGGRMAGATLRTMRRPSSTPARMVEASVHTGEKLQGGAKGVA